jgi:hypothetical protein
MSVLKQRVIVTGAQLSTAFQKIDADMRQLHSGGPDNLPADVKHRLKQSGMLGAIKDPGDATSRGDAFATAIIFYLKVK